MGRGTGGRDLGRAPGKPAKAHEEFAIFLEQRETGQLVLELAVRETEEVRKQDLGDRMGIGVARGDEPACEVEETAHLALRVVKPAGARPAIGATEYRPVPVLARDALNLLGDEFRRLVPADSTKLSAQRFAPLSPLIQPRRTTGTNTRLDVSFAAETHPLPARDGAGSSSTGTRPPRPSCLYVPQWALVYLVLMLKP